MSVPMVRQSCDGGRRETIRYALDSNARTLRFCLIWAVVIISPAVAAAIADLIRHMLLCRQVRICSTGSPTPLDHQLGNWLVMPCRPLYYRSRAVRLARG
jgi:hypothetical protein